ncbi:MAG: hypothetical protein LBH32_01595 [Dysgonamonadaceae bacterium]|nr:hypothetical protein [Dysgonamonadaceae bacterium]
MFYGKKNKIINKYESLWQHLQNDGRETFRLTFEEIKAITGFDIDHSFLTYKKEAKECGLISCIVIASFSEAI